jgi:hypothetical protein
MWFRKKKPRRSQYSVLIDSASRIVLAYSPDVAAVVFANEATVDTLCLHSANYRYENGLSPLIGLPSANYPEWTYGANGVFSRARPELVTNDVRERSRLAVEKVRVINDIMRNISVARYPVSTGVFLQEDVYAVKKMQAAAFRDAGYPEDEILEYPYVVQYADLEDLTLRQAADDILFKARLDEELLAKTESLRLKYFKAVKKATSVDELGAIYEAFIRESYKNALV